METVGKLTPAEYWEWRTTIAEMNAAKSTLEKEEFKVSCMEKDLEINRLKIAFYKQGIQIHKDKSLALKAEYDSYKKKLEDTLKISLNDKIIDDVTFEVKELNSKEQI